MVWGFLFCFVSQDRLSLCSPGSSEIRLPLPLNHLLLLLLLKIQLTLFYLLEFINFTQGKSVFESRSLLERHNGKHIEAGRQWVLLQVQSFNAIQNQNIFKFSQSFQAKIKYILN